MRRTIQAVSTVPTAPRIVLDVSSEPASLAANETLASIMTAAGQIQFPATQNPSTNPNVLDDYEEGTWTPTIAFGGASVGVTYAVRSGSYTKVGNMVTFRMQINLTSKGSSIGVVTISGLPFTCIANTAIAIWYINLLSGNALIGVLNAGTSIGVYSGAAGSASQLTNANVDNASVLILSGAYLT